MLRHNRAANIIAISSSIFSGVSIIVTVLSMTMERSLLDSQRYALIKTDVTGKSVQGKVRKCQKRVRKIRQDVSTIIGLDYALIELTKPRTIAGGLKLEIYLYVSNEEMEDNNYEFLLHTAQQNATLAECIKKAWKLPSVPNVSTIKCEPSQCKSISPTTTTSNSDVVIGIDKNVSSDNLFISDMNQQAIVNVPQSVQRRAHSASNSMIELGVTDILGEP